MKTHIRSIKFFLILFGFLSLTSCSDKNNNIPITVFSVDDDIQLGKEIDLTIMADHQAYPVLDSSQYPGLYVHLYEIRNTILASGKIQFANRFQWKCRILKNDSIVNAFCVPGGNIYIFSGLIKFLDNEAQFAGVLAHEMAHADLRHTSEQLTLMYGETLLLNLILGNNPSQLEEIIANLAGGLGNLAYSRQHEYESDEYAVRYLYPTKYDAASLGDFFTKISSVPTPPAFLSDHPSPADRLAKINQIFNALGGVHGQTFPDEYLLFKGLLP